MADMTEAPEIEDGAPPSHDEENRLTEEFVRLVSEAVDNGDHNLAQELVNPLHNADIADLFEQIGKDERAPLASALGDMVSADVLSEMNEYVRDDLIGVLNPGQIADLTEQLDTDDAVSIIEDLDKAEQQAVLAELEPEEDIEFAEFDDALMRPMLDGREERLDDNLVLVFPSELTLFPEREDFLDRFEALSTIEGLNDNGSENAAMLAARAREDEELLYELLRVYGYYDPQVIRNVAASAAGNESPSVRFDILPGRQYRFGAIDLGALDTTRSDYPALRGAFASGCGTH